MGVRRLVEQPPWPTAAKPPPRPSRVCGEAVRASRPKRVAKTEPPRRARPGRPRPGRHPAGPPGPALRLRRAGLDGRDGGSRCPGQGALRRQVPRRLRRRARRRHRPHRHPHARCSAWSVAEPVLRPGRRRARRPRSPSGTPARAPTCSGSPCRRATRPPRSSRRRPEEAALGRRAACSRDVVGATRRPTRSWATWRRGGAPRAVWSAAAGGGLAAAAGRGRGADARPGGRGSVLVRARPARRGPARRRPHRRAGARPPRDADGRRRSGAALPRVPGGVAGDASDRGRHPRGRVRAGARPRAGGDLGRR